MATLSPHRKKRADTGGSLGERVSFACFSGIFALVLASILWMLFHFRYGIGRHPIPFEYVLYFSGVMAALGFLFRENIIVEVIAGLIEAILDPPAQRGPAVAAIVVVLVAAVAIWFLWYRYG